MLLKKETTIPVFIDTKQNAINALEKRGFIRHKKGRGWVKESGKSGDRIHAYIVNDKYGRRIEFHYDKLATVATRDYHINLINNPLLVEIRNFSNVAKKIIYPDSYADTIDLCDRWNMQVNEFIKTHIKLSIRQDGLPYLPKPLKRWLIRKLTKIEK